MTDDRSVLEREMQRVELLPFTLDEFHRRRNRKERKRRIGSALVALLVAGVTLGALLRASGTIPADDPRGPFVGTWVSTDADGSTQTMTVRAPEDGAIEITVQDDAASVCSGAPSTMTGTGRLDGAGDLVIPSPELTCDDGSEPEAASGPPLQEQLRDLTFVHDPDSDTLTDNLGVVWERAGAADPSPEPTMSGGMWPQSSLEEVREAQQLADAGDPRYTWQVDPELAAEAEVGGAEIFARFLQEELGWEDFRWGFGGFAYEAGDPPVTYDVVFIRCAPGRTNPLYPNDPEGSGCAPTIDELRYETVRISAAQLDRRGPSGIWVVTRWAMVQPLEQVVPPSDAEATALMQAFLGARVDGEGAQEYLHSDREDWEIPLLYATTTGAPYERFEIEREQGPAWPAGGMDFKVRLFAEGGKTVVEQYFLPDREGSGRLGISDWGSTIENGQAVPVPDGILGGEVIFHAAPRWGGGLFWEGPTTATLILDDRDEERMHVLANPLPIETGCREGPAPADAEALARSIRSDPYLDSTEPVAAVVGGIEAMRMDVVAPTGASVCASWGAPPWVLTLTDLEHGSRMRLYLLDLPEGSSARILAIAIVAPEASFERVVEAAAPIVDSFEFRTR